MTNDFHPALSVGMMREQYVPAFLKFSYKFVAADWARARWSPIPDRGFEETFRAHLLSYFPTFSISPPYELRFGGGQASSSGILHELDAVASRDDLRVVWELKNWSVEIEKNAVVGFWAKMLDYLAANSDLASQENVPVFVTASAFDEHSLACALGLGIQPVSPGLRPPLLLSDFLLRLEIELSARPEFSERVIEQADEFRTACRRLGVLLAGAALADRVGRLSDRAISLQTRTFDDALEAASLLRKANAQFSSILSAWEHAKAGST